jgi:fluoroquinolone resistance protein
VAERRHGSPTAPTTSTVSGEDLYGEDLTGRVESRVLYRDVDLTESTSTSGLVFDECVFRDVRFNASSHAGAAFTNCTFHTCTFFGAEFADCKLVGAMFDRCTLERLTVTRGDWSFAGLPGADLRSASFTEVRMREIDLVGVRGDGMTLRRCDLSGAWVAKASFERAELRGSDLSAFDPVTTSLRGAVIDWTQAATLAEAMGLDVRAE